MASLTRTTRIAIAAAATALVALVVVATRERPAKDARTSVVNAPTASHSIPAAHEFFNAHATTLLASLDSFDLIADTASRPGLQRAYRASRAAYKQLEFLIALTGPNAAGVMNGPLPEDDDGPPQPLGQPAAFSRIEAAVFGTDALSNAMRVRLHDDIRIMRKVFAALHQLAPHFALTEPYLLDAIRTELAWISTMGLSGFDTNESGNAVVDAANALDGMAELSGRMERVSSHADGWNTLRDALQGASASLRANTDVASTNHLRFIAVDAAAIGRAIASVRTAVGGVDTTLRVVWNPRAATVFERNAFSALAYAPAFAMTPTPELLALGEQLFGDTRLSGSGTRACSTCHQAQLAFTDGVARHPVLPAHATASKLSPPSAARTGTTITLARNTPTLLNIALHPNFFADGRAATLEDQIATVLASAQEMGTSAVSAASRIGSDPSYRTTFARVFRVSADSAVNESRLRSVLATYVRSLVRLDSRFDLAVQGDTSAMTASERHGFSVFMGKGRCGTCHFAPLFSGVLPPGFVMTDPEIIGVPTRPDTTGATLDPDVGRDAIDGRGVTRYAFNVPTLRNIARTAPYMHNGVYTSLEQVVDFYNRGGGRGVGVHIPYQTLDPKPLNLSASEQSDLVAFLRSLTDRAFDDDKSRK